MINVIYVTDKSIKISLQYMSQRLSLPLNHPPVQTQAE